MRSAPPTVVLVHGAWADGSSWTKVISLLLSRGLSVSAAQIPLTSIEEDAAATKRIIADAEGPVILVGHSWGGMAITQAGGDPNVSALVYVSAFAPEIGETGSTLIGAALVLEAQRGSRNAGRRAQSNRTPPCVRAAT